VRFLDSGSSVAKNNSRQFAKFADRFNHRLSIFSIKEIRREVTISPIANIRVVREIERMKTLTITEGRGRLGKIVALRPVEVTSADYALQEYRLTPKEIGQAERRIASEIKSARSRGRLTEFTGSKNDFC
jgi:hypothetical protein